MCSLIAIKAHLVDAAQRRHIDSLATDGTGAANTCRVFAGAGVLDGINQHLDRVLTRQEVDDLESVLDNAHAHELLAVVAAVHHKRVDHALDDGALGLAEALDGISASGVGEVCGAGLDREVVDERDVGGLDLVEGPLAKQLDLVGMVEGLLLLGDGALAPAGRDLLFLELYVSHVYREVGHG